MGYENSFIESYMGRSKIKAFFFGNAEERERILRFSILSISILGLMYEGSILLSDIYVSPMEPLLFMVLAFASGLYVLYCDYITKKLSHKLHLKTKTVADLTQIIRELKAIRNTNTQITQEASIEKQYRVVLRALSELFNTNYISVVLRSGRKYELKGMTKPGQIDEENAQSIIAESFASEVMHSGSPKIVSGHTRDPLFLNMIPENEKVLKAATLPIKIGSHVIGALNLVQTKKERLMSHNSLDSLLYYSNQLAGIFDKEYLVKELDRKIKSLETARQNWVDEEKNHLIGSCVSGLSVELNSFIEPLIDLIHLMQKNCSDTKMYSDGLKTIEEVVQGMENHLKSLIDIKDEKKLEVQEVDLNKVIEDAVHLYQIRFFKSSIKVNYAVQATLSPIEGVPEKIKQLLLNLLNNACKTISENEGEILLYTAEGKDTVLLGIHVNDNGTFLKKVQHKEEVHPNGKPNETFNLGMTVARKIIEQHRGTINFRYVPDQGTYLEMRFPKKNPEALHSLPWNVA